MQCSGPKPCAPRPLTRRAKFGILHVAPNNTISFKIIISKLTFWGSASQIAILQYRQKANTVALQNYKVELVDSTILNDHLK